MDELFVYVCMMCAAWESFDSSERGYREQVQMLHLLQQLGHRVVVLDADDLLDNPGTLLFIILFLTVFVVFLWKNILIDTASNRSL